MKSLQNLDMPATEGALAGASIYSKFTLFFYDMLVMLFENYFVWKCPTQTVIDFYHEHVTNRHLDVGVGTGYFLNKCSFPGGSPMVHLMDLNPNSLRKTSKRIKRYSPIAHQWNVLEPIRFDLPEFDSICISNILHCLPGKITDKEIVFKNLKGFLSKNGTFFGLTILGKDLKVSFLYRLFNGIYNKLLIFSNLQDDLEGLEKILKAHFESYTLRVVGSVAIFSCKK